MDFSVINFFVQSSGVDARRVPAQPTVFFIFYFLMSIGTVLEVNTVAFICLCCVFDGSAVNFFPHFCSKCYKVIHITTENFNLFMVGDTEAQNLHNILTVMIMITRLIFACICASPPPPPVMIILTRLIFDYICSQPCPPPPPPPTHTHTTHNLYAEVGILKPTVPVYSTECANYHTVAYICCTEVFYVPVTLSEGHCEKFGKYRQVELYPEERVEHTRVPGENL